MRCKTCGRPLEANTRVCKACGTPVQSRPAAQRTLHVTRVAAPARKQTPSVPTEEIELMDNGHSRKDDILFGIAVTVLVIMALIAAALCFLLLTRGPDAKQWFDKEVSAKPTQTAALATPVPTETMAPLPTPEATATPTLTPTPTLAPTPTPTPRPTTAAEGKAALETLLLEGIERDYTRAEVEDLTKYELSILRNGMYAYSGLSFKKTEYKSFFEDCDWYEPNTSDDEKVYKRFNSHQKKNVATILSVEKEKGYR